MVTNNDTPCPIGGIDQVRIKMFDEAVRTLDVMKHVPNLKRNNISLNTLNSKRYKCVLIKGHKKITFIYLAV